MQKDFHFYAIAVLARATGFNVAESITIAYSSQYVDDSTENKPIQIGKSFFDPARTAHFGVFSFDWNVQKQIFIPFHFLPAKKDFFTQGSFVTEPNSELASSILQQAFDDTSEIRLHRIGIALHSFADTWSHRGFSGRHNTENNVSAIRIKKRSRFRTEILKNIYYGVLPQIGHCEAGNCPDIPYLHWKCKISKKQQESNNSSLFLDAAKVIYQKLLAYSPHHSSTIAWDELEKSFVNLFTSIEDDLNKRCKSWQTAFKSLFPEGSYQYSHYSWRKKAFNLTDNKDVDWDNYSFDQMSKLSYPQPPDFYNSDWVHFHKAARLQRALVVANT